MRSAALRAPQTREQALDAAARFAEVDGEIAAIEEERRAGVAAIDAAAEAAALTLIAERKDLTARLKTWFAANFDDLTGGKRKSIEFGGCGLGYRITPPKVAFAGGNDEAALAALETRVAELKQLADETGDFDAAWRSGQLWALIRIKPSIDKPMILRELEADARLAAEGEPRPYPLAELGFSVSQKEEFFIDRAGARAEAA